MSTILFQQIVYGPVHSRRLGVSLGINVSPLDGKRCSFNCIYCECGLNEDFPAKGPAPQREDIRNALTARLQEMAKEGVHPDVITFSGNGEPTMHPEFAGIIDDTMAIRDALCPQAKVAVLSNSTMLHKEEVMNALLEIDECIMKLDSMNDERMHQIDDPDRDDFTCEKLVRQLCRFDGRLVVQTMFLRGHRDGVVIDNTGDEEVAAWIDALKQIRPYKVMIYTIDRETPVRTLEKIPKAELDTIADRIRKETGIEVSISY